MRQWQVEAGKAQRIGVLLFPRFSNHCLANAVEPLRAANELSGRALYRWDFLTLDGEGVVSSSGLPVAAAGSLGRHEGGDALLVLPSYGVRGLATPGCAAALRAAAGRFACLAGLDTGAWLLAAAGLLDGRRATIHPHEAAAFAEAFPALDAVPRRFVRDGPFATCAGASAALDWTLARIGEAHGEALALEVAALLLAPGHADGAQRDPAFAPGPAERCAQLMAAHVEVPLALPEVARRLGLTHKRLARAVAGRYGTTPAALYRRLRLLEARRLVLAGGLAVSEIALRCGYRDASAMTRAFGREFGRSPTEEAARDA